MLLKKILQENISTIPFTDWWLNEEISWCFGPVWSHSQVMYLNIFAGTIVSSSPMLTSPKWISLSQTPAQSKTGFRMHAWSRLGFKTVGGK